MAHTKVSGLSGNEIFCLHKVGASPGQLCVGNSVLALGVMRGLGASLSNLAGGEVSEITQIIHDGRKKSFDNMLRDAQEYGGIGVTGVSLDMINHGGNLEFITIASTVHASKNPGHDSFDEQKTFTTSANAQQLYCQIDAGFRPHHFVFGNVAYSIGVGGNIMGAFKSLKRGEVPEYSRIFDHTRHLALSRIMTEAQKYGANSVIGIETSIMPVLGAQEMIMVGTASSHPALGAYASAPVTSDMTNEEMWNMVHLGFLPIRLVMGVSVYSLGFAGGIAAAFQGITGGEVTGLTEILHEAREKALERINIEAEKYGADEVIGVKIKIFDLGGGLVEFMAIGTAVKRFVGTSTRSPQLIAQAVIQDRETYVDASDDVGAVVNNIGAGSASRSSARMQKGPMAIIVTIFAILWMFISIFLGGHGHRH